MGKSDENTTKQLSPLGHWSASQEGVEENERTQLIIRIGQDCVDLTSDPITISPDVVFRRSYDEEGRYNGDPQEVLKRPRLPDGFAINTAVRQNTPGFGHTTFCLLREGENTAFVQFNEGRTNRVMSLAGDTPPLPSDYREVVVTAFRVTQREGIHLLGSGKRYHMDRMIIGQVGETFQLASIQFTEKDLYQKLLRQLLEENMSVTEYPVIAPRRNNVITTKPSDEDLKDIAALLENGKLDAQGMTKVIAYESYHGRFITNEDWDERVNRRHEQIAYEESLRNPIVVDSN